MIGVGDIRNLIFYMNLIEYLKADDRFMPVAINLLMSWNAESASSQSLID